MPDSRRQTISTPERVTPNKKKYDIFIPNFEYIVAPKTHARMPAEDSA